MGRLILWRMRIVCLLYLVVQKNRGLGDSKKEINKGRMRINRLNRGDR
jgi:hypothetical protein